MTEEESRSGPQPDLLPALAHARRQAASATARAATRDRARAAVQPAPRLPVARVLVDLPLAHLDRPFDYLVPAAVDERVVAGSRVRVRFAGQDVAGFVIGRSEGSDHPGSLAPLRRAVSPEPVLLPAVARLSASVAERYAGTRSDVLRLAVPPRHAATERRPSAPAPAVEADPAEAAQAWAGYPAGPALVHRLAAGENPRTVWTASPGEDWPRRLAELAAATASSGRGALLCVPDRRDLARLDAALAVVLGGGCHVVLSAEAGPAARYRAFLAVSRGAVRVVAGTRAAAFAPVHDLGLVALWDDGDDLYAEPRAPYPHTREVLLLRAHEESCAAVVAGFARTAEAAQLLASGWAKETVGSRARVRAAAPRVSVTGATDAELARDPWTRSARVPRSAHDTLREALKAGPVLVQAPRTGYAAALVCQACREPARCEECGGPLALRRPRLPPTCRWCGHQQPGRSCPECGERGLRAPVVGERRTAEELGRAFPRIPVRRSTGARVLDDVGPEPAIVVATPGAEPRADGGYAAVLLLDTWLALARPDLRAAEESLRRWLNAAVLTRPADAGGQVVAVGDPADPVLQALVRWDPAGFAERELRHRAAAHLPPASRLATLSGPEPELTAALGSLRLPPGAEVLGPVPEPATEPTGEPAGEPAARVVVRVPRAAGAELSQALLDLLGVRAARRQRALRVQVDPVSLG